MTERPNFGILNSKPVHLAGSVLLLARWALTEDQRLGGPNPPRHSQAGGTLEIVIAALMMSNTTHGAVTVYAEPYIGRPLFCSTPDNPLIYDQATPPWVALPFDTFGIDWVCGDLIYIRTPTGTIMARALDTGPFGGYCVAQGDRECLPIRADVPSHLAVWRGLSSHAEVINLSAVARGCRMEGLCD